MVKHFTVAVMLLCERREHFETAEGFTQCWVGVEKPHEKSLQLYNFRKTELQLVFPVIDELQ